MTLGKWIYVTFIDSLVKSTSKINANWLGWLMLGLAGNQNENELWSYRSPLTLASWMYG